MEDVWIVVIIVPLLLAVICLILLRSLERNNNVSEVIGVLISSFSEREKIIEFRGHENKVRTKIREFEVKTIRQTYFVVRMKGRKIISKTEISRFTFPETESLVIGLLDPVHMDRYELKFKASELEKLYNK